MQNRRQFLQSLAVAGLIPALGTKVVWSSEDTTTLDENLVVLLSDLHVGPNPTHQLEGLNRCVGQILAMNPRPANVLMYGDLAYDHGLPGDYELLKTALAPLEEAGIAWTPAFGNHDRRDEFFSVFPGMKTDFVPGRMVHVVETPTCDFILLDSLIVGLVAGGVDDDQKEWLRARLAAQTRPVIVGAHHHLMETQVAEIMKTAKVPVSYIHGHHHHWKTEIVDGVRLLTLPSTGHWGDIGFTTLRLAPEVPQAVLHMNDYYVPRPNLVDPPAKWRQNIADRQGLAWEIF